MAKECYGYYERNCTECTSCNVCTRCASYSDYYSKMSIDGFEGYKVKHKNMHREPSKSYV